LAASSLLIACDAIPKNIATWAKIFFKFSSRSASLSLDYSIHKIFVTSTQYISSQT